jgi:2-polyprenyl-3-methyl-5-hydroxy-6-metoxy-1,4-benzoquinol methylase
MKAATAEKYTREYYLGGIDAPTGRKYGAAGAEAFKAGKIDGRYMRFLRTLPLKDRTVLDLGCGRGEIVRGAARRAGLVIGCDYSWPAVELARDSTKWLTWCNIFIYHNDAVTFLRRDKDDYDIIFMLDVIEHIPKEDMEKIYWMIYRSLKPDGVLIIDTPIYKSRDATDSSDAIPATQGMHCNKQTRENLYLDLWRRGFKKYSFHVWYKGKWSFKMWLYAMSIWPQTMLSKMRQLI